MKKQSLRIFALTIALMLSSGWLLAAEQVPIQEKAQTQKQVYGSQLMTEQERAEHRTKMRSAKSTAEREQIRKEHHERMKERAKTQGLTLPDEPPARGGGMGFGGGGRGR